ncbi:MAG: tetratricopeptide repeat protein [Alphaproteobacteria bacterium]|nr:tetratricopeptide repeat protein [Alphaproteobacteria bacterium]
MIGSAVRTVTAVHVAVVLALVFGLSSAGVTPDVMVAESWWYAFLAANAGVLAGNLAMGALARRPADAERLEREGRREDLSDSHAVVVEQLRALEAERDKLTPEDYVRERTALMAVGAQAARELDEGPPTASEVTAVQLSAAFAPVGGAPTSPATSPISSAGTGLGESALARRLTAERDADPDAFDDAMRLLGYARHRVGAEFRGAAYVLAIFALAGTLYILAGNQSRTRQEGMSITGGDSVRSPSAREAASTAPPTSAQGEIAELRARLAADPDDLDALNGLSALAVREGDLQALMEHNQHALEVAPADPTARTYRSVALRAIGRTDEARATLDAVVRDDPKHVLSRLLRSQLVVGSDPDLAVADLEAALAVEDSPMLRQLLADAQGRAAEAHTPAEVLVSGSLELPEGVSPEGFRTVFVSLRPPGGGMPLATAKLEPGPFPLEFTVTTRDRMGPMAAVPVPPAFVVKAWLDTDGNPMTKTDADPLIERADVAKGTTGLVLRLE